MSRRTLEGCKCQHETIRGSIKIIYMQLCETDFEFGLRCELLPKLKIDVIDSVLSSLLDPSEVELTHRWSGGTGYLRYVLKKPWPFTKLSALLRVVCVTCIRKRKTAL